MKIGNKYYRLIYSFEFPDKSVYVGLTYNSDERYKHHIIDKKKRIKSSVFKYIQQTGLQPEFKLLTEYIDVEIAKNLEGEHLEKYKLGGWNILNIKKTGSIGSTIEIWNREKCIEAAKQSNSRSDFKKRFSSARNSAIKNGWIDECNSYLPLKCNPNGYWNNKQNCINVAKLCKNKNELKEKYSAAYHGAFRNGWVDEICSHMDNRIKVKPGYWTHENCKHEALKYKKRIEFKTNAKGAYESALKNNWLDEVCSHMIKRNKVKNND